VGLFGYPGAVTTSPNFYASTNFSSGSFLIRNGLQSDSLGEISGVSEYEFFVDSMLAWEFDMPQLTTMSIVGFQSPSQIAHHYYLFQSSAGQWYASYELYSDANTTISVDDIEWLTFTPHVNGVVRFGSEVIPGSSLDFNDVQLVGYYQDSLWDFTPVSIVLLVVSVASCAN